jgi:hypothetical protein
MIRGTKGEQVAMDVGSEASIKGGNLRQVRHYIVDPAQCVRGAVAVTDAGVPVVLSDDEVRKILCKPLAKRVVMIFGVQIREVDSGVTGHASIEVSQKEGDVQVGVTGREGTTNNSLLSIARGGGVHVQGNQVQSDRVQLQQNLKSTASM